ncbi:MAG: hypothetical protein LAN62_06725 [Acidobacteriia bacterium]|nr:hypothetical protein [Terriglobia bacterium]
MRSMTLADALISVWQQVLAEGMPQVELQGERYVVARTRARKLRTVAFRFGGCPLEGIEQNPQTDSRWAELARQGKRIMQFSINRHYIANVCEGQLFRYPAWKSLDLPE